MFNLIDWIILIILFLYFLDGLRKGFLILLIELLAFLIGVGVAIKFYNLAGQKLINLFNISIFWAKFLGFLGIFIIFQFLFIKISLFFYNFIPRLVRGCFLNRAIGILLSLTKGLILIGISLVLLMSLPFPQKVKGEIENSKLGNPIFKKAAILENLLEKKFGFSLSETLTFKILPKEEEQLSLPFKIENLKIDPASEEKMLQLLNQERIKVRLKPLMMDEKIREVARAHSYDMFEKGYFAHQSPDGKDPFQRLKAGGVPFILGGENLALAPTVELAHWGLIQSPTHRENILTPGFRKVGIGVVDSGIYGKMFTQDFTN